MWSRALALLLLLMLPWATLASSGQTSDRSDAPPTLRLPGDVRPIRQSVELTLDPDVEPYSGRVEIELDVRRETAVVWLNAFGLEVTNASVGPDEAARPARVVPGGADFVGVALDRPLPVGRATLRVEFTGRVSRTDTEGIFAMEEAGERYVLTQFAPTAARRAFPCFDEPAHKIPWQVSLRVPPGRAAYSNTPAVETASFADGSLVRFAPTRPLPSYLVAFAAGRFDTVDLGTIGRGRVPARLIVPRGRGGDTRWARETTPRLLALLEDYFDRPYPYEKLDQVAIPGVGFAMEHPGLITYGMSTMVRRDQEEAIPWRRAWVGVAAHELAHQWFGNLVTMAWWDDTWLNEAFASWMGDRIWEHFAPDWGLALQRVAVRSKALDLDSLATARAIRQPILSKDDIANTFDGITYIKGKAVLEMTEAWLGEATFRGAVRSYLARYAWGTATARNFMDALSEAAGRDVSGVLSSFLDQTGAPVVSIEVQCDGPPRLVVRQRPYAVLGSTVAAKSWRVPVCVSLPGGARPVCTELASQESVVRLSGSGCPAWSFANAAGAGYYRTRFTIDGARRALQEGTLPAAERLALAGDLKALVASGDLEAADALALVPQLAGDPERLVVDAAVELLRDLETVVDDGRLPRYRAFVRSAFGTRARTLGLSPVPGEPEDTGLLRRSHFWAVGGIGRDPDLARRAAELTGAWVEGRAELDQTLLLPLLEVGGAAADRPLFDRLHAAAVTEPDRLRRRRLLFAIGAATDPRLARDALALTMDDRLDPRESLGILFQVASRRETAGLAFEFATTNYDRIVARLPHGVDSPVPYLAGVAARLCTPEARAAVERFFGPRVAGIDGAPRILAQELESLDQCVARRHHQHASAAAFLDAWTPAGGER